MEDLIAYTPEQETARGTLAAAVDGVTAALHACAEAGLDAQAEMMRMIVAAFAAQGEEVPPMLRMLLG